MKFSAALSLGIAPVALAKAVHNVYPVRRDPNKHEKNTRQVGGAAAIGAPLVDPAILAAQGIVLGSATEVILVWVNPGNNAATTTINNQVTVTQTVTAGGAGGAVAAPPVATGAGTAGAGTNTVVAGASGTVAGTGATHTVTVGGPKGLQFEPAQISAAVGDMVIFSFLSQNHTATQSGFTTPCDPLAGGMDSGFQANANNSVNPPPQVAMQVMTQSPLWFYCRQQGHCGKGMTFSINPTAEKTQAMFQQMAIAQKGTGAGSAITGNGGGGAAAAPVEGSSSVAAGGAAATGAVGATGAGSSLQPLATGGAATGTGAAGGTGVQSGTGTLDGSGACQCQVICGAGAFPAVQAQGVGGSFGGMPGALPVQSMAAVR